MKDINFDELEVGYDVPAVPGMDEADIQTPCLVLDLDALERNIKKMGDYAKAHGMRHRVHGVVADPDGVLNVNDKLKLVPGHCDPTCNVHDWYVGVRNGKVETLWPVSARGKAY